jgi:hypothetical protein
MADFWTNLCTVFQKEEISFPSFVSQEKLFSFTIFSTTHCPVNILDTPLPNFSNYRKVSSFSGIVPARGKFLYLSYFFIPPYERTRSGMFLDISVPHFRNRENPIFLSVIIQEGLFLPFFVRPAL